MGTLVKKKYKNIFSPKFPLDSFCVKKQHMCRLIISNQQIINLFNFVVPMHTALLFLRAVFYKVMVSIITI